MSDTQLGGLSRETVLTTLRAAAAAASRHTLPRFRTALAVDNKLAVGFDPVTEADREAERAVREILTQSHPGHGIVGEEWDDAPGDGRHVWIVDPIDGTRAYICGVPVWGTLIGLVVDGRAVAGMMAQPFSGETWIGLPGVTTFEHAGHAPRIVRTSTVTDLAAARITATSPDQFLPPHVAPGFAALRAATLQTRFGLDCYGYCLLASGLLDLVVEAGLKDVDIAPLIPVIENAGGVVTTWDGSSAEKGGNVIASANRALHDAALEVVNRAV